MRFPLLALAIAACAVSSSGLVQAQNSVQLPLEASNSLPLEMQLPQPGLFPALEITPPARHAAATTAADNVNIDWRIKGAVSLVEDQGQCGSDWAFSAKGSAEGAYFLSTGKLVSLSAQELMDCGHSQGSQGCNGGLPIQGLDYIKAHGIGQTGSYPYTARDGSCKPATTIVKISNTKRSPAGDDVALMDMLNKMGPVSVNVDYNLVANYHGGVHSCASRTAEVVSVLLVGAKNDPNTGEPFWLLKFSYGTKFGEQGYARISRLKPNECGISEDAVVAIY